MQRALEALDQYRCTVLKYLVDALPNDSPMFLARVELECLDDVFGVSDLQAKLQQPTDLWNTRDELRVCGTFDALFSDTYRWQSYRRKLRSMVYNLSRSPTLQERRERGELTADWLVHATPEELWPARWVDVGDVVLNSMAPVPTATSNEFRCGACGKWETTYYQLQTRSADEPMTTFLRCVPCGNRWRS